jgi:putative membrane protein
MPKTLTPGMRAHLDGETTRLATIWQITRTDGVVFRFTDHDRDILFAGDTRHRYACCCVPVAVGLWLLGLVFLLLAWRRARRRTLSAPWPASVREVASGRNFPLVVPFLGQAAGHRVGIRKKGSTKMTFNYLLAGVAAVALIAPPALAQDTQQQPQAQADQMQVAEVDRDFVTEAAQGGLIEVRLGELAEQQAKSTEVKDFGQRMVEDHGQANDKLKQIAGQKGIELPQDPPEDAQATYEELQGKSGAEFDQAYMDEMVSDHEDAVAAFEDYVENAKDRELRSLAEETLPTLKEHLEQAKQTQEQVAAAGEQEQPATGTASDQPSGTEQQGWVSIGELLGAPVVNDKGDDVGEIKDVVMKDNTYYAV